MSFKNNTSIKKTEDSRSELTLESLRKTADAEPEGLFIKDIVIRNNAAVITVCDEDTETVFRLLPDLYATSGFYKDQKITTEQYARLSSLHHYSHAYSSVIRKLTMKDCSESEIREVLTNHKYLTEKQRTEILSEMKQKGFINDEELVRNYIEIAQGNLYGSNRIRASLLKKGIESELIDSYLCSDESEEEIRRAMAKCETAMKGLDRKSHREFLRSLQMKLVTAGYSPSIARIAIGQMDFEKDEDLEKVNLIREYENAYRKYSRKYGGEDLRMRILASLERKGFRYGDVKEYMNERGQEDEDQ